MDHRNLHSRAHVFKVIGIGKLGVLTEILLQFSYCFFHCWNCSVEQQLDFLEIRVVADLLGSDLVEFHDSLN